MRGFDWHRGTCWLQELMRPPSGLAGFLQALPCRTLPCPRSEAELPSLVSNGTLPLSPLPLMPIHAAVLALDRRDAAAFQPLPFHYIEVAHFLFTSGTDEAMASGMFGENLTRVRQEGMDVLVVAGVEGCLPEPLGTGVGAGSLVLVWQAVPSLPGAAGCRHRPDSARPDPRASSPPSPEERPQIKDLVELVQKARMSKIAAGLSTLQGPITVKLNNLAAMEINAIRSFFLGALDMFYEYHQVRVGCGATGV